MFKKFAWIGVMVSCALPAAAGAKMVASEVETLLQNSDGNVSLDFRLSRGRRFYSSTYKDEADVIVEEMMQDQASGSKSCAFEFLKQARAAAVKLPPEYVNIPVKLTAFFTRGSFTGDSYYQLELDVGAGNSTIHVRLMKFQRAEAEGCANLVPADIVSPVLARGTEARRYLDGQAGTATSAPATTSSGRANGGS
jgi:hypothetical protein